MYPRKRLNTLLRAVDLLRAEFPEVELRIAGDGLEWDSLHRLADELRLGSNVHFLGHVADDVAFAYEWRQADIFCHPSCQETFGFVYLEAMTLGKAIVAVKAGAAPEVLDGAALLADPDNVDSLASALQSFIVDSSLRVRYGQLARQRAGLFTHERMVNGYVQIIEHMRQGQAVSSL
jgi:glycosyltransferase involved in cell wall biosynthesis